MKRVLLIGDDEAVRGFRQLLKAAGHEVITTAETESGLVLARECHPDLVVLDIGVVALSIAGSLREQAPEVPVVFVGSGELPWMMNVAGSLGVAAFVEKPCAPADLLRAASRYLEVEVPPPAEAGVAPGTPRSMAPAGQARGEEAPVEAAGSVRHSSRSAGKKILLVEDDRRISLAFGLRLRAAGLQVVTAHDAVTGLAAALKIAPDLLLLDIGLPGGSGLALAEKLRYWGRMTPIIFVTASLKPELKEQAKALGASAYLEKPFAAEELIAAIHLALGEAAPA